MSCNDIETLLDGFVDGDLGVEDRHRVDEHLSDCGRCRATVAELRTLVDATAKLPDGIAPGRDLFPGILERIETSAVEVSPAVAASRGRHSRWLAIAAAFAVVAITGSLALWMRGGAEPALVPAPAAVEAIPASNAGLEPLHVAVQDYEDAAVLLLGAIDERRDRLSPETLAVLDKNLAIIDRAIAEVNVTLESAPNPRKNTLVLAAMHEQKVELLKRVSRLSAIF